MFPFYDPYWVEQLVDTLYIAAVVVSALIILPVVVYGLFNYDRWVMKLMDEIKRGRKEE